MRDADQTISSCRYCSFYEAEGRRGGRCQQLGVSVQGQWRVCSLAAPPFASWRNLERWIGFQPEVPEASLLVKSDQPQVALPATELI